MKDDYNPIELEEAIQSLWNKEKTFETKFKNTNNKYYCLSMFPYRRCHFKISKNDWEECIPTYGLGFIWTTRRECRNKE